MDKTSRVKLGRRSRTKGHSFEREISNRLRLVFPEARRHLEYHQQDANGVDIINTGLFKFQCKKLKKYAQIKCIEEIQCEREFGDIPVLVTAGDHKPIMAVLPFEDFLELLARAEKTR